ncbi:DNA replication licensing factor Mcm5 [Hamiltosporidium tvaerminnensis]|uniref:DNA replication licensing factor MCM5 n=2 Tax=Hamiltosporidium TaxID=1176354 RepID=A0A4Q9LJN3_9MICR|nr:DNA replication licensing factor Mcm5 [Hamiltosporidium tvaerminnensis]TBU07290.1 DNA replication licensing factor Mcm5 [Hamiltosporidium magnivora]
MNWDENQISSIDLLNTQPLLSDEIIKQQYQSFISSFQHDERYIYRTPKSIMKINLQHLSAYDFQLFQELKRRPLHVIQIFEQVTSKLELILNVSPISIRAIDSSYINKIIRIQGIAVNASQVIVKPSSLFLQCKSCLTTRILDYIPRSCSNQCSMDPFTIIPEKCQVLDTQYVKIQETFQDIPPNETPKHATLVLENNLINRITPGKEVSVTVIYGIKETHSYFKVIGINSEERDTKCFTEEEELMFRQISKGVLPDENNSEPKNNSELKNNTAYSLIVKSIAPFIHGMEDVKKAIVCLLFGGTRRILEDGITLRGDLNILLLGDPGVAKSQLLKQTCNLSPVGVYTSGKGSSAAGLTAAVIRDSKGEFCLEGGALVLSDGGVCCIDEFDKMDLKDQVAIHEAMEQQTVSIAKAGITTSLNTRCSVLAAANPTFGRYDNYRSIGENIDFGISVMSRFDFIFIIKDECIRSRDEEMARHIMGIHKDSKNMGFLDTEILRRYILYARSKIFPSLNDKARDRLCDFYVNARKNIKKWEKMGGEKSIIPITVRQLESVCRCAEALARMELNENVSEWHVEEAIRLFMVSTMDAVNKGYYIEGMNRKGIVDEIRILCDKIREMLPVGTGRSYDSLRDRLKDYGDEKINRAIEYLVKSEKVVLRNMGKVIVRMP